MVTTRRLSCFPSQFLLAVQLFLFGPFNCYEAVALDWIHPANLEPDIEQCRIPVDVLGGNHRPTSCTIAQSGNENC
jgi:hypothetical protein